MSRFREFTDQGETQGPDLNFYFILLVIIRVPCSIVFSGWLINRLIHACTCPRTGNILLNALFRHIILSRLFLLTGSHGLMIAVDDGACLPIRLIVSLFTPQINSQYKAVALLLVAIELFATISDLSDCFLAVIVCSKDILTGKYWRPPYVGDWGIGICF